MSANFDSLIIDRALELIAEDISTGEVLYVLNNLSNVTISTSSETKDKLDAEGVLIKRFFTAKTVEMSADCNVLSLSQLATQFGTEKLVASSTNKINMPKIYEVDASAGTFVIPEKFKPVKPLTTIYALNSNGTLGQKYSVHTSATETQFAYDDSTRTITFPTDATGKMFIKYEYAAEDGVMVLNNSDSFPGTVRVYIKVLVADVCSVDTMRLAYIHFPSFQLSPDVEITLDTDSTISYSGVAQRDYCAADATLYSISLSADDIQE